MSNMSINKLYYEFNIMHGNGMNSEKPAYCFSAENEPPMTAAPLVELQ